MKEDILNGILLLNIKPLLIYLMSFLEWKPYWNRVHSSWNRNSKILISNLFANALINFNSFLKLSIVRIKLTRSYKFGAEYIDISNHKAISKIDIYTMNESYAIVKFAFLPKLTSFSMSRGYLEGFEANHCDNLFSFALLRNCSLCRERSDLIQIPITIKHLFLRTNYFIGLDAFFENSNIESIDIHTTEAVRYWMKKKLSIIKFDSCCVGTLAQLKTITQMDSVIEIELFETLFHTIYNYGVIFKTIQKVTIKSTLPPCHEHIMQIFPALKQLILK